ncbi:MAG TPA: hypothetical protein H9971_02675, partial [Candidatus Dorea merdavium]|nr:hypothetical protein [Candidatus Dorea merdavium]
ANCSDHEITGVLMLRILRELFWLLSAGCMNFPEQFFVHRISAINPEFICEKGIDNPRQLV